jgi:hypothetical protein
MAVVRWKKKKKEDEYLSPMLPEQPAVLPVA